MRRSTATTAILAACVSVLAVPAAPNAGAAEAGLPVAWSRTPAGRIHQSSPTIADVDGNGVDDVVVGDLAGWVHVLDARGNALPGWPQRVLVDGSRPTAVESSPTVADLDGDGAKEVIVGAGSTWVADQHGGLVVFNRNGSTRFRWMGADEFRVWGMLPFRDGWAEGVFSTPAVGDVDGDGKADIVFGGWDLRIHALDRFGRELPGFPVWQDDTVWSSPALYDVDGDGRVEIFIGGDSTAGGVEPYDGGVFRALDWRGGTVVHLWKRTIAEVFTGSPAVGDIDGDGRLEAVTTTGAYYGNADSRRVYAFHLSDGTDVRGWPVATGASNTGSVVLGDLTGDDGGRPEVVLGSRDGRVYAFRGTGVLHWSVNPARAGEGGGEIVGSPVVHDLDGNGALDVAVGNGWATFTLSGRTGARLYAPAGKGWSYQNSPAVGNFGPSGWRLVVGGMQVNGGGFLAAHTLASPGKASPWPMWRKNARHLGAAPSGGDPLPPDRCRRSTNPAAKPSSLSSRGYWVVGHDGGVFAIGGAPFLGSLAGRLGGAHPVAIAPTASGNGYYVLTDRGAIHTFGDARSFGSMAGVRLNRPIIALAPTPSGKGYWLLGEDGGVFSFGDARFYGSTGGLRLNARIISMAATSTGRGYWLLGEDGGVFTFGDARFRGSTGGIRLAAPVISMATAPSGAGYWLIARDGGVFSFGVPFHGSVPGIGLCAEPVGRQIRPTRTGAGYFVLAANGVVFAFGDAKHRGNAPALGLANYGVDLAVRP